MFGPSGKLYQPPSFKLRLQRDRGEELSPGDAEEIAEGMARVNDEKRRPAPREDQTAV